MKRKKIILWSVFAVGAICMGALMIEAIIEKNFRSALWSWFMISIGLISVQYLLNKDEAERRKHLAREEKIALFLTSKRGKITLWSVFAVSAICLIPLGIEAIIDKKFITALWCWFMIVVGFVSAKHLSNKNRLEKLKSY